MRCASAVGDAGGAGGAERLTRKQSACAIDVSTMVMPVVVVVLLLVMERAWGQRGDLAVADLAVVGGVGRQHPPQLALPVLACASPGTQSQRIRSCKTPGRSMLTCGFWRTRRSNRSGASGRSSADQPAKQARDSHGESACARGNQFRRCFLKQWRGGGSGPRRSARPLSPVAGPPRPPRPPVPPPPDPVRTETRRQHTKAWRGVAVTSASKTEASRRYSAWPSASVCFRRPTSAGQSFRRSSGGIPDTRSKPVNMGTSRIWPRSRWFCVRPKLDSWAAHLLGPAPGPGGRGRQGRASPRRRPPAARALPPGPTLRRHRTGARRRPSGQRRI